MAMAMDGYGSIPNRYIFFGDEQMNIHKSQLGTDVNSRGLVGFDPSSIFISCEISVLNQLSYHLGASPCHGSVVTTTLKNLCRL